jgi:class 3 adenylate cyclase
VRPALADLVGRGQVCAAGMPFLLQRSLGVAHRLSGHLDDARALLDEAFEIARREDLHVEMVRTVLDLADLADLDGDLRGAADRRAAAATDIRRLGLWGLANRAGVRPPAPGTRSTEAPAPAEPLAQVRSTILFADISASTRITAELGDVAFRFRSRQAETAMRSAVAGAGGRAIDGIRLGDGILAELPTAKAAAVAGLSMIDAVQPSGLQVHVGVHQGDVIREDMTIFGGAVNLTARICDQAGPSQLLVSEALAEALADVPEVEVSPVGDRVLKGFGDPVHLHSVQWVGATRTTQSNEESP